MWFAQRSSAAVSRFGEADPLPMQLLEDAAGDNIMQLRRDAVRAAHVLQEVQPALAFTLPLEEDRAPRGFKWIWLGVAAGVVAGLLLAYVLAQTVFASPYDCRSFADGSTFTCIHRGG